MSNPATVACIIQRPVHRYRMAGTRRCGCLLKQGLQHVPMVEMLKRAPVSALIECATQDMLYRITNDVAAIALNCQQLRNTLPVVAAGPLHVSSKVLEADMSERALIQDAADGGIVCAGHGLKGFRRDQVHAPDSHPRRAAGPVVLTHVTHYQAGHRCHDRPFRCLRHGVVHECPSVHRPGGSKNRISEAKTRRRPRWAGW